MPIYEYACTGCGHQFEEWQKISDSPVRKCPNCGKRKVERLVSLSSFHLKGSGWYVTDYGGKKSGSTPSSDKTSGTSDSKDSKGASKKKKKE
jgi:putative FmdB family regulatory protein